MRDQNLISLLLFISFLGCLLKFLFTRHFSTNRLPPGPGGLPLIGHLHLLRHPVYETLHKLSQKYGQVMFLKFGVRKVVVVSSPEAVEECFTKNDIIFANRPQLISTKIFNYPFGTLGFAPYGDHWRNVKRLVTAELLSTDRLSVLRHIREEEIHYLLKELKRKCGDLNPTKVELKSMFVDLSFNIMTRMMAGKRYYGREAISDEAKAFRGMMSEVMKLLGVSNFEDWLPIFQWADIGRLKRKMVMQMKIIDSFLQELVEEHRNRRNEEAFLTSHEQNSNGSNKNRRTTLIDQMLSQQESDPEYYTDESIKSVILSLIFAGTEAAAVTLEWAMALLLNHPEAKKKASEEIEACAGESRLLDEDDIPKLTYLNNTINETFRLYPSTPLLMPHESSDDCTLCGYEIPKGTILLVNAWSLHRDPRIWKDPTKFKPERFDIDTSEVKGCTMIPFGMGRRACPGSNLGKKVVALALGILLQCFDWEIDGEEMIDMSAGFGLSMPKSVPLEALCKPRQTIIDLV